MTTQCKHLASYASFVDCIKKDVETVTNSPVREEIDWKEMPHIDEEYAKIYPSDVDGIEMLAICMDHLMTTALEEEYMSTRTSIFSFMSINERMKRWRECSPELDDFLQQAADKPGSIFYQKHKPAYGSDGTQSRNFSDIPQMPIKLGLGRASLAVGFVDLFYLFGAQFVKYTTEEADLHSRTATVIGVDGSCLAVAKSQVVVEMLRTPDIPTSSAIQVWLSSAWESTTFEHFQSVLPRAIENVNYAVPAVDGIGNQQEVQQLLQYWTTVKADDSRLRLPSVHKEWRARNPPRSTTNHALPNMKHSRDRVAFARYMVTGEFPPLSKDDTSCSELIGNVCMFACPGKYTSKVNGETVFGALPLETILTIDMEEGFGIFDKAYKYVKDNTDTLRDHLLQGRIDVRLYQHMFSTYDVMFLSSLRKLRPFSVVWTNICDHMSREDFHSMARRVSWSGTIHYMHSIDWIREIHGAHITDVPLALKRQVAAISRSLIRTQLTEEYPCFNPDVQYDRPSNLASFALTCYLHPLWVNYFFDGYNLKVEPQYTHADYVCTLTNCDTLYMEWTYL